MTDDLAFGVYYCLQCKQKMERITTAFSPDDICITHACPDGHFILVFQVM